MLTYTSLTTDSFFGIWSMFGRYIVFLIYAVIIASMLILSRKNKIKKSIAATVASIVLILTVSMFIGGANHNPGFSADGVDDFYYGIQKELTDEKLYVPEYLNSDTEFPTTWKWTVEKDGVYAVINVYKNNTESSIQNIKSSTFYSDSKTVSGSTDHFEYLFSSLRASNYIKYLFLKSDYIGDITIESSRYTIRIDYIMKQNSMLDYLAVIYPIIPKTQYDLSYLL